MKPLTKFGSLFLLFCCLGFSLGAQPGHHRPGPPGADRPGEANFERIKAARQQFLIQRLELTEQEVAAFFPLFWRYDEEIRDLMRKEGPRMRDRRFGSQDPLTEAEAREQLERQLDRMDRLSALKRESTEAYLKIVPAAKLIKLEEANRDFRKELLDRLRRRRN